MANNLPRFEMIFTGNAKSLKAATAEVRSEIGGVRTEAKNTAAALDQHTAATQRNADAQRKLAQEERKVREEMQRAGSAPAPAVPSRPAGGAPSSTGGQQGRPSVPGGDPTAAEIERRRAELIPLVRVQREYRLEIEKIRAAEEARILTADESAAAVSRATVAYERQLKSLDGKDPANDNFGRNRRQVLGYQAFDIGQGLFSGMPLQMIAAQQGPQIAQMYAGQGGMNAALQDFKTIGSGVLRMFTPLTVGVGAVTAALAVGGVAYAKYLTSVKEVETAASGLGRAVAGTASELEASAQAGAAAAGVSVAAARSMQAQFLRTGKIGAEHYEQLIALSKDFAATMGMDAASAGDALADMFTDPAKAAQRLNREYGLLDAATTRRISDLAAQNRVSEAQGVLLDALPGKLASAEKATTRLGRAWNSVATGASNALDRMGRAIDRVVSGPSASERIAEIDRLLNMPKRADGRKVRIDRGALENERQQLQAEIDAEAERRRKAEQNQRGAVSLGIAEGSGVNATAARERELRNQITALQQGRDAFSDGSSEREMIDNAIEAKTRALDALVNAKERNAELDRLDIQIANTRNPLLRAELEARRTRLQMADQEVDADKIATEAARARNRVIEETIASASASAAEMSEEIAVRRQINAQVAAGTLTAGEAQRAMEQELRLRPLIAAAAGLEGEKKKELLAVIEQLRTGYAAMAEAEKEAQVRDVLRSGQDRITQLRVEMELVGQNEAVRGRAMALLEAEQRIREAGISSQSKVAEQIRAQAVEQANLARAIERQAEAWGKVQTAAEGAVDKGVDALLDGNFSDAAEEIAKDIRSAFADIAIKAPLKNALFGTDYGTISDIGGISGIFSRLFGGAKDPASIVSNALGQSVGAMSVTAGSVVINGALSGTGDIARLFNPANSNVAGGGLTGTLAQYAQAIKGIESSGNYNALGPLTGSGDRAYGAYQIMGANIGPWSKAALGRSLSIEEFLANPSLQDQIFNHRFGGYVSQYGATGAAKAWFGGPGAVNGSGNASDILGTSVNQYAAKFNSALEGMTSRVSVAGDGLGVLGTGFDKFGNALSIASVSGLGGGSASGGGLFSWLGSLFSPSAASLNKSIGFTGANTTLGGLLGFKRGGPTGGSNPDRIAGFAHEGEYYFDAVSTARIGIPTLEAIRKGALGGYKTGGYATSGPTYAHLAGGSAQGIGGGNGSAGITKVTFNDYAGQKVQTEERDDPQGGREMLVTIGEQVAAAASQPGNPLQRQLRTMTGARAKGTRR